MKPGRYSVKQMNLFTKRGNIVPESESRLQSRSATLLREADYLVLETSEHRRPVRCPHCGGSFTPHDGRGTTKGVPDLLISRVVWPALLWLGLETKLPAGSKTSPEQKLLEEQQRIAIYRTPEEALALAQEHDPLGRIFGNEGEK